MGFIAYRQRRRTNQLLADQISVAQTGKTIAQRHGDSADIAARIKEGRDIDIRRICRKSMMPGQVEAFIALSEAERQAWADAHPEIRCGYKPRA